MSRMVHFTLVDGRSILATFDDEGEHMVEKSPTVICVSETGTEHFPLSALLDCRLYDGREPLPPRTRVFDFAIAS